MKYYIGIISMRLWIILCALIYTNKARKAQQIKKFRIHETCPYPFTHGKYAWTSNIDLIKFQFTSLYKGCHQLPKKGRLKALVWFR